MIRRTFLTCLGGKKVDSCSFGSSESPHHVPERLLVAGKGILSPRFNPFQSFHLYPGQSGAHASPALDPWVL